jgi:fibronectin-binding autotransporter adhesin
MRRFGVLFFAVNLALISCRVAVASTWTGGTNANWSNGANWSGGEPNSTSTALFNAGFPNGTTTPLLIDTTGLQVLNLNFDTFGFYDGVTADTGYTIGTSGGNPLTIANGGTVSLLNTFDGTDITESINAPLTLAGGTITFDNAASLASGDVLSFGGTIGASAGTTLTLAGPGKGVINGAITNGSSGLNLNITGGVWTLNGANTYSGTTTFSDSVVTLTGSDTSLANNGLLNGGGINYFTYAPSGSGSATQVVHSVNGSNIQNIYVLNPGTTSSATLNFQSISEGHENDYVILGGASSTAKIQFGQPTTTFFNTGSYYGTSLASPSSSYVAYDATLGSFRAINYGVDAGSALSPGGATIASGATVAGGGSIGSSTYVQTTGAITAQTTTSINTLTIDGGYNFTLGSGQVLTLNDGGLLKTGGNSATMSGGTLTTGGSKSLTIHTDEASDVMTISSAIGSMSGGITKQGAGTLVLNGTSTYSGATTITNGTLDITGNSSGAGGTYNVEDGTLQIGTGGSVASTAAVTLGDSTLNGTLVLGDSSGAVSATIANLSVLGSSTGTGNAVVNGNTADSSASTLTVNNATMDIYTGVLGGSGTNNNNLNLTKSGAGTLDLTGVNTYTGTTSVQNGIVQIGGSAGSLSSSTAVVLGSGSNSGILQLGDGTAAVNQTVSSLTTSGSGSANAVVGGYTGNSTLTVNNNSDDSYTGVIGGAGPNYNNVALVKSGTGTLTLGGANTYTGGTTVTAGKLAVNGSVAGNVAAQGGAEVGGSGSIGGTISGAGAVGPGNSPGILSAASVNPSAGTSFNFEFTLNGAPTYGSSTASGNDVLHLEGGSPFTAALTAGNVINLYFAGAGSYLGGFFVNGSDNLSANIANATFNYYIADATGAISYNGNNYELTSGTESTIAAVNAAFADGTVSGYTEEFTASAVPEPSTYVLMFGGLFLLGLRLRRKASLLE